METSEHAPPSGASSSPRLRTPQAYRTCDRLTEGLIYFGVVFAPWAFGTTEQWSIRIMNSVAYILGALLLLKWIIRWRTGYSPARWGEGAAEVRSPGPAH